MHEVGVHPYELANRYPLRRAQLRLSPCGHVDFHKITLGNVSVALGNFRLCLR